jgi:hypothetical protein
MLAIPGEEKTGFWNISTMWNLKKINILKWTSLFPDLIFL